MIDRTDVLVLTHRLSSIRLFGTGSNLTRDSIVVRLEDGDGLVGWGETYLVPGAVEAARAMAADLKGRRAEDAAADLETQPGLHRWALGAVSMALDDLRARRRGVPVSELFGPRIRDRVEAYASSRGYVDGRSAEASWLDEAWVVRDAGFRAIKLRVGRYPLEEEIGAIERVVAEAPAMAWMADGNGAYSIDESRRLAAALERLGFRWLEEPLPTSDYGAYAPLAREVSIPLAGGETLESADAAAAPLTGGSFDIIQPDVSIAGGIGGALEIARLARSRGVACIPHACSGAIALAATLQLLAVLPDGGGSPTWATPILEYDVGENPIRTDLADRPVEVRDGWVDIPAGPGLGIDVNEAAVRQLAVAA